MDIEILAAQIFGSCSAEELEELKTLLTQELEIDACEVCGCSAPWEWEGWMQNRNFSVILQELSN